MKNRHNITLHSRTNYWRGYTASLGWLFKVYLDIILHYTVERIIDEDIQLALVGYLRFI
jgi:hypothetical protein